MVNKKSRNRLRLQQLVFIVLFLAFLAAAAMLSQRHSAQFDWTSSKRNTLSESSILLLKSLDSPVNVSVFAQDNDTTSAAIREILNRYQRQKADFNYQLINPDIDIVQAETENIDQYGQIVIKYKGQRESVNSLSEKAITSALIRMSRGGQRIAAFLTGHGERSIESNKNYGLLKFAVQLRSKGYELTSVNLLRDEFPKNISILVIASPENKVLPGESEKIARYVKNGGNLFWLQDPGKDHDLKILADLLSIKFVPGIIVDDNSNLRATLRIQHPAIIPVLEYMAHPISKNLQYNTIFPISGGLTILPQQENEAGDWQSAHVLRSLPRSWSETGTLGKEVEFSSPDGDTAGPITLGIAMSRMLDQDKDDPIGGKADADSKNSQRVVVIGDSDFLSNSYTGAGANLALGLNIFDWLANDDALISIDPKNAPDIQLQLDDTQILIIGSGFLAIIPLGLMVTGFTIWLRRRNA